MARPQFKRNGEIDKQLEDLVKASSWKQAVALCERRIKKGDKSDAASVGVALHCGGNFWESGGAEISRGRLQRLMSFKPVLMWAASSRVRRNWRE